MRTEYGLRSRGFFQAVTLTVAIVTRLLRAFNVLRRHIFRRFSRWANNRMKSSEIVKSFWPYLIGIWLFPVGAILFLREGWLDSKVGLIFLFTVYFLCIGTSFVPSFQRKLSRGDSLVYGLCVSLAVWGICVLTNVAIGH